MYSLRDVAALSVFTAGLASAVPSAVDKRSTEGVGTLFNEFVAGLFLIEAIGLYL
jgi:hypothetical protein